MRQCIRGWVWCYCVCDFPSALRLVLFIALSAAVDNIVCEVALRNERRARYGHVELFFFFLQAYIYAVYRERISCAIDFNTVENAQNRDLKGKSWKVENRACNTHVPTSLDSDR